MHAPRRPTSRTASASDNTPAPHETSALDPRVPAKLGFAASSFADSRNLVAFTGSGECILVRARNEHHNQSPW